jgi:hypothetical protein
VVPAGTWHGQRSVAQAPRGCETWARASNVQPARAHAWMWENGLQSRASGLERLSECPGASSVVYQNNNDSTSEAATLEELEP